MALGLMRASLNPVLFNHYPLYWSHTLRILKPKSTSLIEMASIAFPEYSNVVTLRSGVTYNYTHIPAKDSMSTILFIHGFPSSSYDWRHQIRYFSSLGYGVIAPDLLGYGETDKPTSADDYRGKKMASELSELLNHAKVSKVHGVAHDWGSFLLSRMTTYHRERLLSSAFLATPYRAPGQIIDVDSVNAMSKKDLGFELLGYWKFFKKEDAGEIVKEHVSLFSRSGFLIGYTVLTGS
jgi:soluble epoxide hydrolase/lipid-phosphate phosphatase